MPRSLLPEVKDCAAELGQRYASDLQLPAADVIACRLAGKSTYALESAIFLASLIGGSPGAAVPWRR